ncbi:hypothetical protein [Candidatus Arsenophonus triatominarum]|uniref:hypothetical protein n=1 Tax=Candidatus Arsenophonus triatominarum TaxID=57911 RepID=UPI000A53AA09|nr:hypothetical protein [Candidatus Arsenophonus triatominarum]
MRETNNRDASGNDANTFMHAFSQLLAGCFFCEIVQVIALHGEAPNLVVDVRPLLAYPDTRGVLMESTQFTPFRYFACNGGTVPSS